MSVYVGFSTLRMEWSLWGSRAVAFLCEVPRGWQIAMGVDDIMFTLIPSAADGGR